MISIAPLTSSWIARYPCLPSKKAIFLTTKRFGIARRTHRRDAHTIIFQLTETVAYPQSAAQSGVRGSCDFCAGERHYRHKAVGSRDRSNWCR